MDAIKTEIFEEIRGYIDKIQQCSSSIKTDNQKINKISTLIEAAEPTLQMAEEKRGELERKNKFLRAKLDNLNERISWSINYWQEFGLEVEQLPDSNNYKFIFNKLDDRPIDPPKAVVLDDNLKIVSRSPEDCLTDEDVTKINESDNNQGDHKLVMLRIKRALTKRLA